MALTSISFWIVVYCIVGSYSFSSLKPNRITTQLFSTNKFSTNEKLPLPFMETKLGLVGNWYEKSGNYILKPKGNIKALGVIHFLGGAFVGAAPHLTYRYLLESLSDAGYIIVATPYRLNMDYTAICDSILTKFEGAAFELATELGPVPVIGLGHSCGALLQTLITSLFPDTPRALNVLISYNNKPANKAIPAFQEAIIPFSERLMGQSDEATRFREAVISLRKNVDSIVDQFAQSEFAPSFIGQEVLPLLRQGAEITDQFVPLLGTIASGVHEFSPTPVDTKEALRRMLVNLPYTFTALTHLYTHRYILGTAPARRSLSSSRMTPLTRARR